MTIIITIEMDNIAFEENKGAEIRRILRKLGDQCHNIKLQDGDHMKIYDSNGMHVGDAIVE